jgi:multidrug efflux pump subunit AcrA (membrane-fusion protein)
MMSETSPAHSDEPVPIGAVVSEFWEQNHTRFPTLAALTLPSPEEQSGMEAEVNFRLDLKAKEKRFILPPDAIGIDGKGGYVYVVKPSGGAYGALERRPVSTSALTAFGQEVTNGLSDGELVVIRGINRLQHGMKVKWK